MYMYVGHVCALQIDRQLEACGIVESIQVSAAGHANKITYASFAERYQKLLLPSFRKGIRKSSDEVSPRAAVKEIVVKYIAQEQRASVKYGRSRVFLKDGHIKGTHFRNGCLWISSKLC